MRKPSISDRILAIGAASLASIFSFQATAAPAIGENPPALVAHPARPNGVRAQAIARWAAGARHEVPGICLANFAKAGEDEVACRLLSAASYLEDRRWVDAEAVLRPAIGRLGPLEPWGALFLGEALAGAGKPAEALPLLEQAEKADPEGPLGRRAEVPRALALAHAGKLDQARKSLNRLLTQRRGNAAELRLTLAEAMEAAGKKKEAAELYRKVWREHAGSEEAVAAEKHLATLGGVKASTADRLRRIEVLLAQGRAAPALEELESIPKAGHRAELALLRARALSALDRKAEAEEALKPALGAKVPAKVRAPALEQASRLAMRRGATDEAVKDLDEMRAISKGNAADNAEFLAAFFLYDAGRHAEAETRFRAYAERPKAARGDEADWYVAWTIFKQGRHEEAALALEELPKRHATSELVPQAAYWRARALAAAGRKKEATSALREVASRWPLSWYGLLASSRLGGAKSTPTWTRFSAPPARPAPEGLAAERLARAVALYGAGLVEQAGSELDASLKGQKVPGLPAAAAQLAFESGDHHRAWQLGLFRLGGLSGAADLAFPRAFGTEVERAAAEFDVDPYFIWAIMRQESGFRPAIRSHAAAVGLMQLLPKTARKIAPLLHLDETVAERLEDPSLNVKLGGWYLGALLGRFGGSHALAAAAYNGGPEAVVRWLQDPSRKDLPLDEFVESIPYRETRHYVKRVVSNLHAYRMIHGAEPLAISERLPKAGPGVDF